MKKAGIMPLTLCKRTKNLLAEQQALPYFRRRVEGEANLKIPNVGWRSISICTARQLTSPAENILS